MQRYVKYKCFCFFIDGDMGRYENLFKIEKPNPDNEES